MYKYFLLIFLPFLFNPIHSKSWKDISKKELKPRMSFSGTGILNRARRDIFNIPYNKPIPQSILDTYTPEQIGYGLVYRIQHKCSNVEWNKNITRREKDDIPGKVSGWFKNRFSGKGKSRYETPKYNKKKEFMYLNRPKGLVTLEFDKSYIEKKSSEQGLYDSDKRNFKNQKYLKYIKKLTCLDFYRSAKSGRKSNLEQISPPFTGRAKLLLNDKKFAGGYNFIYKNDVLPRTTFSFGTYSAAWDAARFKSWRGINFDYPSAHSLDKKERHGETLGANVFGANLNKDLSHIVVKQVPPPKTMAWLVKLGVPIIQIGANTTAAQMGSGKVIFDGNYVAVKDYQKERKEFSAGRWKKFVKKKAKPRMSFSGTGVLNRARKDIFDLPFNGPIPKKILDSYTPQEIGYGLVYRIQNKCSNSMWNNKIKKRNLDDIPHELTTFFKDLYPQGVNRYNQPKYNSKEEFMYLNKPKGMMVNGYNAAYIEKLEEIHGWDDFNQEKMQDKNFVKYLNKLTCLDFSKSAKEGAKTKLYQISPRAHGMSRYIVGNQKFYGDYNFVYKDDVLPRTTFTFGHDEKAIEETKYTNWRGLNFDYPSVHDIIWKNTYGSSLGANIFGGNIFQDMALIITNRTPPKNTLKVLRQLGVPIVRLPASSYYADRVDDATVLYGGGEKGKRAKEKWKKITGETVLRSLSFSNAGRMNKVRKAVLNIPIKGAMPDNIMKTYNSKEIGTAIAYRVKYKCLQNYFNKPKNIDGLQQKYKDFLNKVRSTTKLDKSRFTRLGSGEKYFVIKDWLIMMAAKAKFIESIYEKGFLNMFQIGHGTFYKGNKDYYNDRINAENDMTCMNLGKNWSIRPKYSFFMPYQKGVDKNKVSVSKSYGNLIFQFKSEIKLRTTWTFGDSLNRWDAKDLYLPFYTDHATVRNLRGKEEYYEAQIYGDLTKDDVAVIYVRGTPNKTLLNNLKKFKVEIYSFSGLYPYSDKLLWKP